MAEKRAPFPSDSEEFAHDTRISYSKTAQTFVLEDDNGEEWEWLPGPKKWSKTMDEELVKQQAEAYKVAGVDEDAPALNPAQKRKEALLEDPEMNPKNAKANANASAPATATVNKPRQNTAVFLSGLPDGVDKLEIRDYFAKYGLISESIEGNEKRIYLYNDKDGNPKGEALVVYLKPESVKIAIDMADDQEFLRRDPGDPTCKISVKAADMNYKAHKDDTVAKDRPKAKPTSSKAQAKKKLEEMNAKLADWSDDEVSAMPPTSNRDKVVVIRNLFTLSAAADDPELLGEIYEDLQDEAPKYGDVKNITVFDLEPQGIATIRFATAEQAENFCAKCDGRDYDERTLRATVSDGSQKFKKTRKTQADKDAEEAKRLEAFSKDIEEAKDQGNGVANGGSSS